MYVKAMRGLSSVVGALFLVVLVLLAWTLLFRYALLYLNIAQSQPQVSLSSSVSVINGGVYMVEVTVRNMGDLPFTLEKIIVNNQSYTGSLYEGFPVVTSSSSAPTVSLPLALRPGQEVTLYYFTNSSFPGSLSHPIIMIEGQYGTSTVMVQSSAEVLYG